MCSNFKLFTATFIYTKKDVPLRKQFSLKGLYSNQAEFFFLNLRWSHLEWWVQVKYLSRSMHKLELTIFWRQRAPENQHNLFTYSTVSHTDRNLDLLMFYRLKRLDSCSFIKVILSSDQIVLSDIPSIFTMNIVLI